MVVPAAELTHWVRLIAAAVLLKPTGVFVGKWTGHHVCIQKRNMPPAEQTSTAQAWMARTVLAQPMMIVVKDILVKPVIVISTNQQQNAVLVLGFQTILVGLAALQAAAHAVAPVAERDRVALLIAVLASSWQMLRIFATETTPSLA